MLRFAGAGTASRAGTVVRWLAERGHALSVIAAAEETAPDPMSGVRIQRLRPIVAPAAHGIARVVGNVSFALASAPTLLMEAVDFRPDVVAALTDSSAVASSALAAAHIAGAPAWLHLDEEAPALGVESAYGCVSLAGFDAEMQLEARGVAVEARLPLTPWTDTRAIVPRDEPSPLRLRLGIDDEDVVALHLAQAVDEAGAALIIAAARCVPPRGAIRFVVCSDARPPPALREAAGELPQLVLLPWPHEEGLNAILGAADIHLMLRGIGEHDARLPAKLADLLASARPIIACRRNESRADPLSPGVMPVSAVGEAIAAAVVQLAAVPNARRLRGIAARCIAQDYFEKERVLRGLERRLMALAAQ